MISFSQNREDVLLNRVFCDRRTGFYIDVGAAHPTIDSVTRHFYDHGWRGINIEPRPDMFGQLVEWRDRDINLRVALSASPGWATLHAIVVPGIAALDAGGLSTLDAALARHYRRSGYRVTPMPTELATLEQVCLQHRVTDITFLKIDVEGHEAQVLRGNDWQQFRPCVVLVEATEPQSSVACHEPWESILLDNGYVFATFDGVNRYYVRAEDRDVLWPRFQIPVNVHDNYQIYDVVRLREIVRRMQTTPVQQHRWQRFVAALAAPVQNLARRREAPGGREPGKDAERPQGIGLARRTAPWPKRPRRVFLDCGPTARSTMNTGIQRVVRNVVRHAQALAGPFDIECHAVHVAYGRYCRVRHPFRPPSARVAAMAAAYDWLCHRIYKLFPLPQVEKLLLPKPGHSGILKIPRVIGRTLRALWMTAFRRVRPRRDDLFLLVDAHWGAPETWPVIQEVQARGAMVGSVIYDLIPITHPQFCMPRHIAAFTRWLQQAIECADFFVAISETIQHEMCDYLRHAYPDGDGPPVGSFALGCVVDGLSAEGPIRDALLPAFPSDGHTYLTVGTLEPRKNHGYLLDAFDRLWRQMPTARLCIVGREGWLCEEILRRIRSHPRHGQTLFHFDDLSDAELNYCYRHARACLMASHVEGFGLPIVEALHHGLPVLASNTPVHREVGRDACAYFDLADPDSLARLIVDMESGGPERFRRDPREIQWPDWRASSHAFLTACLELWRQRASLWVDEPDGVPDRVSPVPRAAGQDVAPYKKSA